MRRIRWVGHPSPLEDPAIQRALENGTLPFPLSQALRRFEHNRRVSAVPGHSEFMVGPSHGFSRTYHWLPHQELEMTEEDWALLAKHPLDRYMFMDVTEVSIATRPPLSKRQWQELIDAAERTPPPAMSQVR